MQKVALVLILSIILFSCEKDEKLPPNPEWLNTMITQLESSPFPGYVIWGYKWNEEYYYVVYNLISSCLYCETYDYSGTRVTWNDDEFEDFLKNGKQIKTVWEKGFNH
jgi:hypothetical protein